MKPVSFVDPCLTCQQFSFGVRNFILNLYRFVRRIPSFVMSTGGAFGGNRGLRPIPPEKGIFPLDHLHECDSEKKEYLGCLKTSAHKSEQCRHLSKKYLECRMAKNLMAKQDMAELGFSGLKELDSTEDKKNKESIGH